MITSVSADYKAVTKIALIFVGWQISWIRASYDWNTMAEIRQNKFDRDSWRNGQVVEIGKYLELYNNINVTLWIIITTYLFTSRVSYHYYLKLVF